MKDLVLFSLWWCWECLKNGISTIDLFEVILASFLEVIGFLEVVLVEFDISDVAESINYISKELLYVLFRKIIGRWDDFMGFGEEVLHLYLKWLGKFPSLFEDEAIQEV